MTASQTAVIAKRATEPPVETGEIEAIAVAAGFTVEAVVTQVRDEDPATHLGAGKVEAVAERVTATDASAVVVDGELHPGQARELWDRLPPETELYDRYRLVLRVFADQANDRRAQLQVDLARLEYERQWYEAVADESPLTRAGEKGSRRYDLHDRIQAIRGELRSLPDAAERTRRRRREAGFDLVTIAGYTNAGKSTLLRRLADDMSVAGAADAHADTHVTAAVEDRLFKTLETTTRRATLRGRPVLCTDTVGYVSDLPHNLVATFGETLSEAGAADLVVLVTDPTDPSERFEDKLAVAHDVLDQQGVATDDVLPVANKADLVDAATLKARLAALRVRVGEPIAISAERGTGIETLIDRIVEGLPTARRRLRLPMSDRTMSFVSTLYDRTTVCDVEYGDETVTVTVEGRPSLLASLQAEVEDLTTSTA